jgi:hypothetical protein
MEWREGKRTHNSVGSSRTAVGYQSALHEDILLEGVSPLVCDRDLNLLHDQHDGSLVIPLPPEVGLAEEIVEIAVESILLVLHDEHLVDLLHDGLLEPVVDDLEVLLLHLDDLLLVVERVEAVDEVEALAIEAVGEGRIRGLTLGDIGGEALGAVDGF